MATFSFLKKKKILTQYLLGKTIILQLQYSLLVNPCTKTTPFITGMKSFWVLFYFISKSIDYTTNTFAVYNEISYILGLPFHTALTIFYISYKCIYHSSNFGRAGIFAETEHSQVTALPKYLEQM